MPKKLTRNEVCDYLNNINLELIGEYRGFCENILLKCNKGHIFESTFKNIKKTQKCPICEKEHQEMIMIKNIELNGFKLISYYSKNKHKIVKVRCEKGHINEMSYDNILKGNKCKVCQHKVLPSINFIKEFIEAEGYKMLSEDIPNATTKFQIECPCGHKYEVNWNKFYNGRRCPYCSNKVKLTKKEVEDLFLKYGYTIIGEYNNTIDKVLVRCPNGHEYYTRVCNFKKGRRCSSCKNVSKGEIKIKEILESINIEYIQQHKFDGCKNKLQLPFDFFLPKYNICIEYDGIQHFESIELFRGEHALEQTKFRDDIKTRFCKDNNILLIRIPYWEFNNIEDILKEKLSNLK